MENRSFRTALMGGFRKKDVVRYLAEEIQQHELVLKEAQQQRDGLEKQLAEAHESLEQWGVRLSELEQENQALAEEKDRVLQQLAAGEETARQLALAEEQIGKLTAGQQDALQQLEEARLRASQAENQLAEAGEKLAAADGLLQEAENRARRAEAEGPAIRQELSGRIETLQALLEEARSCPAAAPEDAGADGEAEQLRLELKREREKNTRLEARLQQLEYSAEPVDSADQMWLLCGKMERTIRQMERMLDEAGRSSRPAAPGGGEAPGKEEPCAMPSARPMAKTPTVTSLLQRVRGK